MTLDELDEPAVRLPDGYALMLGTLVSLGAALTLIAWPARHVPVDVRFCNATDSVLTQVRTYGAAFGDIAAGQCSGYRRIARGYSNMGFAAGFGGTRVERWPEDHIGEPDLARGPYSFVIRETTNGLEIKQL